MSSDAIQSRDNLHTHELSFLSPRHRDIIMEISLVYTGLEHIINNESNLSHAGRVNMRRTQAQVQNIRLTLLDMFEKVQG